MPVKLKSSDPFYTVLLLRCEIYGAPITDPSEPSWSLFQQLCWWWGWTADVVRIISETSCVSLLMVRKDVR